ncbi:MAG: Holliday junction resolvase RuvX [Oscillatoria sp. SIO1A7]|nr:Holliday junction resolvase RuvX [Oscillatoria sp. SIO1A7]
MILGFDPGRQKCGIAVMAAGGEVSLHRVVSSDSAIATIESLCQEFPINLLVMGDRTSSKEWKQKLLDAGWEPEKIAMVDENYSTVEACDRYWQMYPAKGLWRLVPQGMRQPPKPVDDIVAIILIERYLAKQATA